jgi:hypothetical protein
MYKIDKGVKLPSKMREQETTSTRFFKIEAK